MPYPPYNAPYWQENIADSNFAAVVNSRLDRLERGSGTTVSFFSVSITGRPSAGQVFGYQLFPQIVSFDTTLCAARCDIAPTALATFTILDGGTVLGSVVFQPGMFLGTPAFLPGVALRPSGAFLKLVAPASQDATMSGIGVTLGYRG